jgi:hypothetical protein
MARRYKLTAIHRKQDRFLKQPKRGIIVLQRRESKNG